MSKMQGKNPSCPKCRARKRIYKAGKFPSRGHMRQRYICFNCGKTFYAKES